MDAVTVSHVSYTYPQQTSPAVNDACFTIASGSYTAVAGLNGSGKSTLARIICGLLDADSGSVTLAKGMTASLVFQSPKDQIICGTVSRDTAFGPQNLGLQPPEVELRTIECLNITGLLHKASSPSLSLSLGQTQKEAISGIIALQPDVLVLDEAVSMLDPDSRGEIFRFLSYWSGKGRTVVHITHDMDAIRQANNVIVMKNGAPCFTGASEAFFRNSELCSYISGPAIPVNPRTPLQTGKVSFAADHICFSYGAEEAVRDVSFSLRQGSLTALTGVSGSGKSTILELAAGLLAPSSGSIRADSRPALAQQNSEAALFERFAADDVAFGPRNRGISGRQLVNTVKHAMDTAGIPFSRFADRQTFCLSGGEQRRLAVAGIIALDAPVLLFDEPTAGLDGPSRFAVMQTMKSLADSGHTVLFSTHRRDEADFADREIAVLRGTLIRDTAAENNAVNTMPPAVKPLEGAKMLDSLRNTSYAAGADAGKNGSIVSHMKPALKYIVFLTVFISSLAVRPPFLCAALFGVSLAYAALALYPAKRLASALLKVIPLLLFFCIFQMIFYPALPGEKLFLSFRYFTVSPSKLMLCLTTLLHTEAALACIVTFMFSTSEHDIITGFSALFAPLAFLHVPVRYAVLIIEIIFRFIPLLIDEASAIIKTQLVRGGLGKAKGHASRIKAAIPLLVPLISQTIRRSEALADALTMRCFR